MADNTVYETLKDVLMQVSEEEYGEGYKRDLLSMYREFVASAEKISDRRNAANSFFLAICIGLLGGYSFIEVKHMDHVMLASIAGVFFCGIWFSLIKSYKNLNSAKFKVLQEIEKNLPLAPLKAEEWVYTKPSKRHIAFSKLESIMPGVFAVMFTVIVLHAAFGPEEAPPPTTGGAEYCVRALPGVDPGNGP